ncbi:MAG: hypothetical protein JWN49_428 [Parcubacteria group bacterium]|nr:hypothetical protein [Parcubacteria group bacterium]
MNHLLVRQESGPSLLSRGLCRVDLLRDLGDQDSRVVVDGTQLNTVAEHDTRGIARRFETMSGLCVRRHAGHGDRDPLDRPVRIEVRDAHDLEGADEPTIGRKREVFRHVAHADQISRHTRRELVIRRIGLATLFLVRFGVVDLPAGHRQRSDETLLIGDERLAQRWDPLRRFVRGGYRCRIGSGTAITTNGALGGGLGSHRVSPSRQWLMRW